MKRQIALVTRLEQLLAAEGGIALVSTLGVVCALALAGTSVVAFSATNYGNASRSKADAGAYALAEAGINDAASVINAAADPSNPSLLPVRTVTYESGTAQYSGTFDAAARLWTITATGELRNPTGVDATPVRRTVTAKVSVASGSGATIQSLSNQAWNYVVVRRTGNACDETLSSSVSWSARLYVFGNLCLASGSSVVGGPLDVKGQLNLTATDTFVGTVGAPLPEVHAGLGCKYTSAAVHSPCSTADHVYGSVVDSAVPALSPPVPEWDRWYTSSSPGPTSACTSSSGNVPQFDNDAVRNNSVTTTADLTPSTSYSCTTSSGQLSWDAGTHILTVNGTVFFDGNVKAGNGTANSYAGRGVIYTSGTLEVSASTRLCAVVVAGDCDFVNWNPDSTFLGVVANGNGGGNVLAGYSVAVGTSGRFQGAVYGSNGLTFGSSSKIQGPIDVSFFSPCSLLQMPQFPTIRNVPAGLPGQPVSSSRPSAPFGFSS